MLDIKGLKLEIGDLVVHRSHSCVFKISTRNKMNYPGKKYVRVETSGSTERYGKELKFRAGAGTLLKYPTSLPDTPEAIKAYRKLMGV